MKTISESTPRTLQLELQLTHDRVNVSWSAQNDRTISWDSYFLQPQELERYSKRIETSLGDLESLNWNDSDQSVYLPVVRELAEHGSSLYRYLLHGDSNDPDSIAWASEFREWFESEVLPAAPGSWRIQIIHRNYSAPIVPWGLTYSPGGDLSLAELGGQDDQGVNRFWCSEFSLACRGTMNAASNSLARQRKFCKIAIALEVDDDRVSRFQQEYPRVAEKLELRDTLSRNTDEFEDLCTKHKEFDVFWYIHLRSKGQSYVLAGEEFDERDMSRAEAQGPRDRVVIMVLDGDAIIRRARGAEMIDTMLRIGRSGLIAAETDIKNPQLRFLGWEILKYLFEEEQPLIRAIENARRKLWPKSLLFGVYCDPLHVYVDPPPPHELVDHFLELTRGDSI